MTPESTHAGRRSQRQTYQLPIVIRSPAPSRTELQAALNAQRRRADELERRLQAEILYSARLVLALRGDER